MGFLDGINKLLFVEDENKVNEVVEQNQTKETITVPVPRPAIPSVPFNLPPVNYPLPTANVDPKFRNALMKLLADNNLAGTDYYEFSKAVKSMANKAGINEGMRYQVAFDTLKAMDDSLTKDHLVQTADHYINILSDEEKTFDKEAQDQVNTKVTSLITQAKNREDAINDKREQVAKLVAEIESMQTEINDLNVKAQNAQTEINFAGMEFKNSVSSLKVEIVNEKALINQYIN